MKAPPCINSNKKKVYLISNRQSGDILLNLLKEIPFISEIRIGSPNIIKEMTESFLSLFDCVIYDFKDGGFQINTEKTKEIEAYIKNDGGSFLVTHDQWDCTKGPLNLIGLERYENFPFQVCNKAKVNIFGHEIFNSYHNLKNWTMINIAPSHKTFHKIIQDSNSNARIIMEYDFNTATDIKHDYLVVNEIGNGRIAYWAAGHTPNISSDEKLLFINIVAWLTKYKN